MPDIIDMVTVSHQVVAVFKDQHNLVHLRTLDTNMPGIMDMVVSMPVTVTRKTKDLAIAIQPS